jgi:hypothetical protein
VDEIEPNGPDFTVEGMCSTTPSTSATTAPGSTLSIGMGRPERYLLNGTEIPSVTHVLDSWHPGGVDALCQWSHNLAKDGKHWRVERDTAGDFGTYMHDAYTRLDRGEDADDIARHCEAQWSAEGLHAFREYERFLKRHRPVYTHAEITLYSSRYAFGGTFDRRTEDASVGDFKGAKVPRVTMIAQLGAYGELMRENGLGWPARGWLFHFPRELRDKTGRPRLYQLHNFSSGELLAGRDAFLRLLDAHRFNEELEKSL